MFYNLSMSTEEHKQMAEGERKIRIAVVTVSDTRTPETDKNGPYLQEEIEAAGHALVGYQIIKDEPDQVLAVLNEYLQIAQVILFNGGTGIAQRDTTFDALNARIEKPMPGFGELFRMLSYDQIGSAAILSRAMGGITQGVVIFSTPGSHKAVQLAWEKLIAPELGHIVWELKK